MRRAMFDATREADAEPTWDEERGFTVQDLSASMDPSPERALRFPRPQQRRWAVIGLAACASAGVAAVALAGAGAIAAVALWPGDPAGADADVGAAALDPVSAPVE